MLLLETISSRAAKRIKPTPASCSGLGKAILQCWHWSTYEWEAWGRPWTPECLPVVSIKTGEHTGLWLLRLRPHCSEKGELHYALSSNSTAEKERHISAQAAQARQGL